MQNEGYENEFLDENIKKSKENEVKLLFFLKKDKTE